MKIVALFTKLFIMFLSALFRPLKVKKRIVFVSYFSKTPEGNLRIAYDYFAKDTDYHTVALFCSYGKGLGKKLRYFLHTIKEVYYFSTSKLIVLEGNNITLQVLDAILCHNGEMRQNVYYPQFKTKEMFLTEYKESYKNKEILKKIKPMTLEGCVVRISDVIAYIGKDIEDAIRLNIIKKETIPQNIISTLGETNSEIVNTIVKDIIKNSLNKNYIKLSKKVFMALHELIEFNYKNIYKKANTTQQLEEYKFKFNKLFDLYLEHITQNKTNEDIYILYLNDMHNSYITSNSPERIAIDYLAGMTDNFFNYQYQKYFNK